MTSINTVLNSNNYGLQTAKNEAVEESKQATTTVKETVGSTGIGGAYNLDLSEEALAYLKSLESAKVPQQEEQKDYGFVLTAKEQEQLDAIVKKYADLPYTQENFDKLQAELKASRLDSLNLAAKEMVRSFNSTTMLMDALSGKSELTSANDRLKTQSGKSESYMNQLASDWYNQIMISDDV